MFEDELAIGFLPRKLTMPGRVLLAPRQHLTEVADDFSEGDYLELQRRVHRVGRAVSAAFDTDRLYVSVMLENGHLDLTEPDKEWIAEKVRKALA